MVLQSLCVSSPMEKKATPKGVMAQWRAYSGSSDIQKHRFTNFSMSLSILGQTIASS